MKYGSLSIDTCLFDKGISGILNWCESLILEENIKNATRKALTSSISWNNIEILMFLKIF